MHEYQLQRSVKAPRGAALSQSKLTESDILDIRSAQTQRVNLLKFIRENLSNEALATKFGVHVRTVEKVLSRETWGHIE